MPWRSPCIGLRSCVSKFVCGLTVLVLSTTFSCCFGVRLESVLMQVTLICGTGWSGLDKIWRIGELKCEKLQRIVTFASALWIGKVFEVSCIFLWFFLFQAGRFLKKSHILLSKKISGTLLEILKNMIHKLASK